MIKLPDNLKYVLNENIAIPRKPIPPIMPKHEFKFSDLGEHGLMGCFLIFWTIILLVFALIKGDKFMLEIAPAAFVAQFFLILFLFVINPPIELKNKELELQEYNRKKIEYESNIQVWNEINNIPKINIYDYFKVTMWTKSEAEIMAKNNYRNKY